MVSDTIIYIIHENSSTA